MKTLRGVFTSTNKTNFMSNLKTYDLFLSHAWNYNTEYYRLEEMLFGSPYFSWRNYSVPEHDPIIFSSPSRKKSQLTIQLEKQIRPVNCVLIIGGMYAAHSEWILTEIEIAKSFKKPIIGIYPWQQQKMPIVVQESADELVRWNTNSIISAIRKNSI